MAHRPRDRDAARDGTQEYQWLYGDEAEHTQVIEPEPDEVRPPRRPRQVPAEPEPRPRRRRRWGRWVLAFLLLWLAWLVAVPVYAWSQVREVAFEPGGSRPGNQPGTTYLLVGSDSRAGLTAQQRRELGTGNVAGQRTDTIMLLHTGSGPNLLMSIPRDSLVDIPGHGTTKVNAAYAWGGPKLLVKTLEQATGIHIDHFVEIGFGGVVEVVDAVGGIQVCPKTDMVDKLANLDIRKGCQEVDGKTALAYSRSRHTDAQYGDIGRAAHQREVVASVGHEVLSPWTVLNPWRYWQLAMAAPDSFSFGKGTSLLRAGLWASAMTRVNGTTGLTCGVPISDLAVHWDTERAPRMFRHIINDTTDEIPRSLCTPTGTPR